MEDVVTSTAKEEVKVEQTVYTYCSVVLVRLVVSFLFN